MLVFIFSANKNSKSAASCPWSIFKTAAEGFKNPKGFMNIQKSCLFILWDCSYLGYFYCKQS